MKLTRKRASAPISTKSAVFESAAALFSNAGFDGVSVDDIARAAGVNKAMIYYHFADKLALYRAVLADGLSKMGAIVSDIAASADPPAGKLDRFIEAFVRMTETRPWMPALMLREIAEGAPRLDADTMAHMRVVITSFAGILAQGQQSGVFRPVHPILAYESVVGPIIINAARERVAAQPDRKGNDFPMLIAISHDDVIAHGQDTARRMLAP
jgi:TetR/AcrR family transcriptional regulator